MKKNINEAEWKVRVDLAAMFRLTHMMGWDDTCLLYTSDAADEGLGVDLGGRRIIKKWDPSFSSRLLNALWKGWLS